MEIYNEGGVAITASYDVEPATLEERTAWFERLRNQGHPVLVLEEDGRVVGFASYGPFRDKAAYRHTVEHSVYVASLQQQYHLSGFALSVCRRCPPGGPQNLRHTPSRP